MITNSSFLIIFGRKENTDILCAVVDKKKGVGLSLSLPGGKKRKNETIKETAIRESLEEGWDVSHCQISKYPIVSFFVKEKQKYMYWFLVTSGIALMINPAYQEKNIPIFILTSNFLEHFSVNEYHKNAIIYARKILNN